LWLRVRKKFVGHGKNEKGEKELLRTPAEAASQSLLARCPLYGK
jgi:hypothetical protein